MTNRESTSWTYQGTATRTVRMYMLLTWLGAGPIASSPGAGQRMDITASPQSLRITNPTRNAFSPTIRILGRTRYADESGVRLGNHWYLVLDPPKRATNLQGARVLRNARNQGVGGQCDDDDFLHFDPNGSAEVSFEAPEKRVYRLRFRCPPYGNTGPVLEVAVDGQVVGKVGSGVIEDVSLTAGPHVLTLKEAGYEPIVASSRLVCLDLIEITTDRQEDFSNDIQPHPSDPERRFWKVRPCIPLSNPALSDGQRTFALDRTLADGELAIIHPDGTASTGFDTPRPAAWEDEQGLEALGHLYFRIDPWQVGQLEKASRQDMARERWGVSGCHRDRFILLNPGGSVTVHPNLPRNGHFRLSARLTQIGNAPPVGRFLIDGEELGRFQGSGGYRWYTVEADLEAGTHGFTLQECGTSKEPNTNMINLDLIEVSTDPNVALPDGLVDGRLPRFAVSLVAPADVSANRVPVLSPGDATLTFTDATVSSQQAVVEVDPLPWRPLRKDVGVLQPNGDGIADEVQVTATLAARAKCTVAVHDVLGKLVRRVVQEQDTPQGEIKATWDGRDETGNLAPRGSYEVRLVAEAAQGDIARWATVVGLDPYAPPTTGVDLPVFSPNNDNIWDTATLTYRLAGPARVRVTVRNAQGQAVRALFAGEQPIGSHRIAWDGRDDSGQVVPRGIYRFDVATAAGQFIGHRDVQVDPGYSWPDVPAQIRDFFPIGVWFGYAIGGDALRKQLRQLKQDGFNAVSSVHGRESLDIVGEEGMKAIAEYGCPRQLDEQVATSKMAQEVRLLKESPGLLAYYLADEPGTDEVFAHSLGLLTRAIAKEDPIHPSLACLIGTQNLDFHTKRAPRSVLYIDIYPVWKTNAVGDFRCPYYNGWDMTRYFDYAQNLVGQETPTWVIVQCHSFADQLREPTPTEIRCQTYLNLAHGAKGIFYFTLYPIAWLGLLENGQPTPRYEECARLARVMQQLAPTLLKLVQTDNVATVAGGGNSAYDRGEVTTLRHRETGALYVWAVNRNCEARERLLISARSPVGGRVRDVLSGRAVVSEPMGGQVRWPCDLEAGEGRLFELQR